MMARPSNFTCFAFALVVPIVALVAVGADDRPDTQFPTGAECAARMTVPPGFNVSCFAS